VAIRLPADLLSRSAEEASRLLSLAYLDEISRAQLRLADPLDTEALHDFRVGLRRLRSCIRAYRGELEDSINRKTRQQLRKLTEDTNAGRDSEVQLHWLYQQTGRLVPEEMDGLAWLVGKLEGRKFETLDAVRSNVGRRFSKLASKLRPELRTFRVEVRTGNDQRRSFGQLTGDLIVSYAGALRETLASVGAANDKERAHAARIAAKRLRYLLEPLSRRVPRAKSLVGPLKQLQDLLGELHDMQVMGDEIASSMKSLEAMGAHSRAIPGLLQLQQIAREQAHRCFATFDAHWRDSRSADFLSRVVELGRRLSLGKDVADDAGLAPLRQEMVTQNRSGQHDHSPVRHKVGEEHVARPPDLGIVR
jgi:CHAD domain-containing protein